MLESIIFSIFNGVLYGMLLFMLASGLTLIFGMMGVLNFAHAGFYMLGAYFAYQISVWANFEIGGVAVSGFWVALICAPIVVALVGAAVQRWGLRQVHQHGHLAELLFTFGLVYVLDEFVHLIWGNSPVDYRVPEVLDFTLFTLFTTNFPAYRVFMLGIAVLMFISLFVLLTRTRVGQIVQASLSHPDMVGALGHNVPRVFTMVFAFGCGLAGLAGVIAGNYLVTEPGMAQSMGSIVFVVVVFGGLGSLNGALIGSLILGLVQTFAVQMNFSLADMIQGLGGSVAPDGFMSDILFVNFSRMGPMLPYLLLVLMLIFRPRGLMGTRES